MGDNNRGGGYGYFSSNKDFVPLGSSLPPVLDSLLSPFEPSQPETEPYYGFRNSHRRLSRRGWSRGRPRYVSLFGGHDTRDQPYSSRGSQSQARGGSQGRGVKRKHHSKADWDEVKHLYYNRHMSIDPWKKLEAPFKGPDDKGPNNSQPLESESMDPMDTLNEEPQQSHESDQELLNSDQKPYDLYQESHHPDQESNSSSGDDEH